LYRHPVNPKTLRAVNISIQYLKIMNLPIQVVGTSDVLKLSAAGRDVKQGKWSLDPELQRSS
ncbi:MAG: hypothetical protein AAGA48_14410, partial [Myxococcota bacterium]